MDISKVLHNKLLYILFSYHYNYTLFDFLCQLIMLTNPRLFNILNQTKQTIMCEILKKEIGDQYEKIFCNHNLHNS